MGFLKNGKLVCLGWHFKYYFFFNNFYFKQLMVSKIHRSIFFWLKKFKTEIEIAVNCREFWHRTHAQAWYICCYQSCKQSSWSCLCMSSPSPLHRLATQHFDESYKPKQCKPFLSQLEHTIWVSRHRTLRAQYLHLSVFLWKQYIIRANSKDFCKFQSFCLCTPSLTLT